ncbi:MAG: AarF/ABC1/UbiB kinase family protein [Maricaulaceae bacterium]
MATNIAGSIVLNGVQQLATGQRPKVTDLILTPANAHRVTTQLSNMRGAAMKIGQIISMDSGDFLPKELADILSTLRSSAMHMPRSQLNNILSSEWGEGWEFQFENFEYHPIAAASIGQVQQTKLPSGERLAIKVQYPGIKESIDSDVNNVAALLRMTGLLPAKLDVKPIIEEGRKQLHEEANYIREATYLSKFGELLAGDNNFEVPKYYPKLSTRRVLAMSYIDSVPIEDMVYASQEERNRIVELLIDLTLRELFVYGVMQTDPNFANYRYNTKTNKLVLLDFGASRDIAKKVITTYRAIMQTSLSGTSQDCFDLASKMGLIPPNVPSKYKSIFMELLEMATEILQRDKTFDFGNNDIALRMRDKVSVLAGQRDLWHVPPAEMIFIQRKFGGIYMLSTRLGAVINIHALIKKYVGA